MTRTNRECITLFFLLPPWGFAPTVGLPPTTSCWSSRRVVVFCRGMASTTRVWRRAAGEWTASALFAAGSPSMCGIQQRPDQAATHGWPCSWRPDARRTFVWHSRSRADGTASRRASIVASSTTRFRALQIVHRATRCKITIWSLVALGVSVCLPAPFQIARKRLVRE